MQECLTESKGRNTATPLKRLKVETGSQDTDLLPFFLAVSLNTSAFLLSSFYVLLLFVLHLYPLLKNDHNTPELYTSCCQGTNPDGHLILFIPIDIFSKRQSGDPSLGLHNHHWTNKLWKGQRLCIKFKSVSRAPVWVHAKEGLEEWPESIHYGINSQNKWRLIYSCLPWNAQPCSRFVKMFRNG